MATRSLRRLAVFTLVLMVFALAAAFPASLNDEQIRQILIRQSIQSYPGNCPCPYNLDRVSRRCGKRSAWSRPGGYSPLCYSSDVTQKMIEKYRKEHGG